MWRGRKGGGCSAETLLATSEENNSDVSMNVRATPTGHIQTTFGLRAIYCTCVTCSGECIEDYSGSLCSLSLQLFSTTIPTKLVSSQKWLVLIFNRNIETIWELNCGDYYLAWPVAHLFTTVWSQKNLKKRKKKINQSHRHEGKQCIENICWGFGSFSLINLDVSLVYRKYLLWKQTALVSIPVMHLRLPTEERQTYI